MDRKVVPITGSHQSVSSFLAEMMADDELVGAWVIGFTAEGVMRAGHYGCKRQDTCMALGWLQAAVVTSMQGDE